MANAPIQIILNPENFRRDRVTQTPKGAGKDFYEDRDAAFAAHRQRMQDQIKAVQDQLSATGDQSVGYLKVSLKTNALAKSHRPFNALFTPERATVRGSTKLGEIIAEVTPQSLALVGNAVGRAETEVRRKPKKDKPEETFPVPTRYRCEVGALDRVELWGKSDRRRFELTDAIRWLSDPRTGHAYTVELFEMPPPNADWNNLGRSKQALFNSFYEGLQKVGPGLVARWRDNLSHDSAIVEVLVTRSEQPTTVFVRSRSSLGAPAFDPSVEKHQQLIGFLESHPLVRQITLPGIVVRSPAPTAPAPAGAKEGTVPVMVRDPNKQYPVVGVIDGGVSDVYAPWVIDRYGLLADEHASLEHGSFISGLLVEGSQLNPTLRVGPDGCLIADLNVFPDENQVGVFEQYYSNGIQGFFDEIETAVATMRRQHGVRIFNFSINVISPVQLERYSQEARRLDKIADDHDVIFVISAGNLGPKNLRGEWPGDEALALALLAAHREDQLFVPAESVRNVSVAAINPDGLSNSLAGAPARYSRRGPGLKTGVKPDLCHVGGSGTACPIQEHGLFSRDSSGGMLSGCGTSYAAPLVARELAALDSFIEGEPARETLMALALHHARLPQLLQSPAFDSLARKLVGFGTPAAAADALDGNDHQITLLFSSRIHAGKSLVFDFSWPPSLVGAGGKCRGAVQLTLVSTPTVDYRFGDELVRVNVETSLQQDDGNGKYKSCGLEPTYVSFNDDEKVREADLIEHMFKWSPVKVFAKTFPNGRGNSSNWRLTVNYLLRAGETIPKAGIPLSILLTIADPDAEKPVFQEMRQLLQAGNYKIADIRTAARITPRV